MPNLSELVNTFNKLISKAIIVQCLILGISSSLILTFVNIRNTERLNKIIDAEFKQVEGQVTQALFVREAISSTQLGNQHDLPGLDFLRQNLEQRDIRADISLAPCEPIESSRSKFIYSLDIGTRKLNTCVVIDTSKNIDTRIAIHVLYTIALSFLVMLSFWFIFKNQLSVKYITPAMKELDEMNRVFVAGKIARQVAHDIRSPLSALQLAAKSINTKPAEAVQLIQMTIERIDRIVNDLLIHAPNKNHSVPSKQSNQALVNDIVKELVIEKQAEHENNKKIVISQVIDENHRALINTANIDLKRILSNLVNNSIEATDDKPNKIQITTAISRDQTHISIRDTGAGINETLLKSLNDMTLLNKNLTTKINGHGLGLSWSKSAIHSFGGQICIKSKPGEGCIIDIKLPTMQVI